MVAIVGHAGCTTCVGSSMTSLVSAIHAHGAKAVISFGGSDDGYWSSDCVNGYQYLLGAWFANYITTYGVDGMEIDEELGQGSSSTVTTCWNGIAAEMHSIATTANQVPTVQGDVNPTDNVPASISLAATKANLDQLAIEYYGANYDNNCSANCQGSSGGYRVERGLSDSTTAGWPAQKVSWISASNTATVHSSQAATTVLGTTTSALASGTNVGSSGIGGIPVSGIAAVGNEAAGSMPAGLFIIADPNSLPQSWHSLRPRA
jgi:hypothetical protein